MSSIVVQSFVSGLHVALTVALLLTTIFGIALAALAPRKPRLTPVSS